MPRFLGAITTLRPSAIPLAFGCELVFEILGPTNVLCYVR
jgi:hypothetical protein